MNWLEWLVAVVFAAICAAAVISLWGHADDNPSCRARGGKPVFSHHMIVPTGKTTVLIPQYRCAMP